MIYIASPYTHMKEFMRHQRYIMATHAVAHYSAQGVLCYSPVVHFHNVAMMHDLPKDFHFWEEINYGMLRLATQLCVLKIDGWDTSFGVMKEIEYAERIGVSIIYLEESEICPVS